MLEEIMLKDIKEIHSEGKFGEVQEVVGFLLQELEKATQENKRLHEDHVIVPLKSWNHDVDVFKKLQEVNKRYKEAFLDIKDVLNHKIELSAADKRIQQIVREQLKLEA